MSGGRGALETFGMAVRDLRYRAGHREHLGQCAAEDSGRRNSHRRAVAEATVGLPVARVEPALEHPAVTASRVTAAPVVQRLCWVDAVQQGIRHGDRAHRIVGEVHVPPEELELLRPVIVELENRADDVTDYRAEHDVFSGKC